MSEVEVRTCTVAEIFDDPAAAALFAEYESECGSPLLGAAVPDRTAYEGLAALGVGQAFSGRLDGSLCGLAFLLMAPLPHYGRRFATVESLVVSQAARSCGLGKQLMKAVEAYAQNAGCATILYSAKADSQLARMFLLLSDEYQLMSHVFGKRLA